MWGLKKHCVLYLRALLSPLQTARLWKTLAIIIPVEHDDDPITNLQGLWLWEGWVLRLTGLFVISVACVCSCKFPGVTGHCLSYQRANLDSVHACFFGCGSYTTLWFWYCLPFIVEHLVDLSCAGSIRPLSCSHVVHLIVGYFVCLKLYAASVSRMAVSLRVVGLVLLLWLGTTILVVIIWGTFITCWSWLYSRVFPGILLDH